MKKLLLGAIIGGLILFVWQTLSNTALNLHSSALQYTAKQDSILDYLSSQLPSGRYILPTVAPGATMDDMTKLEEKAMDKPWAIISLQNAYHPDMVMSMVRTLLVDVMVVGMLCWVLLQIPNRNKTNIFIITILTGLLVFLNGLYTQYIWYQEPGINGHLIDALASWGLCGFWLSSWLSKS
jgi:hypothetical protein